MADEDRPLVWLHGEIRSPPFSKTARVAAGHCLRLLQEGASLGMPHSRPMPGIGPRCHELRIQDQCASWRIVYRLDADAVVILDVFEKRTRMTPHHVIAACRQRLSRYEREV
jgi:phage-related protein